MDDNYGTCKNEAIGCDAEAAEGKGGDEAAYAQEQLENCDKKGIKPCLD